MNKIVKFAENRVRRSYLGGAGIDKFMGRRECRDGIYPENWIASTTKATNKSMETIENEGLSSVLTEQGELLFSDYLASGSEELLGKDYYEKHGASISFLVKLLDSSVRLSLQAHPTREYANQYLSSPYGKTEFYYILHIREEAEGYIYLGFQNPPERQEFIEMVCEQSSDKMLACFKKIKVNAGDCWYIPGGLPHAIGEGILMIEVMEPSDLVLRYEYNRKGLEIPFCDRFMGKEFEHYIDIFDLSPHSVKNMMQNNRIQPKIVAQSNKYKLETLAGTEITDCFFVQRLTVYEAVTLEKDERFRVCVLCGGSGALITNGEETVLSRGDCFFVASGLKEIEIKVFEQMELCMISDGNRSL